MATIKECDRCSKQWNPTKDALPYGRDDMESCSVSIIIPRDTQRTNRPAANRTVELCQDCAREILKRLEPTGKVANGV